MKLRSPLTLTLAATALLAACTTDDAAPHDGDAHLTIGADDYRTGGVFGTAGSYVQVFLASGANADDYSADGDPRVEFMLEVDRTDAPHVLPSLVLDDDVTGPRLIVYQHDRTEGHFANSGIVRVLGGDWEPTDVADVYRPATLVGTIEATLDNGAAISGNFTVVRERHSGQ